SQVGDIEELIRNDQMGLILDWLRTNVHQHGRRYPAKELIMKATGKELSVDPFIGYLKEKYSRVYGISL
ncbi:MAG: carboxypeptidase M32, partial [Candidatus Thermoplasmatota archaeon]|nr:carboxypeptidase M32 [Candidatus Thermoplasmatota archaeon]